MKTNLINLKNKSLFDNPFSNFVLVVLSLVFIVIFYNFYISIINSNHNLNANLLPSLKYSTNNLIILNQKEVKIDKIKTNLNQINHLNSNLKNLTKATTVFNLFTKNNSLENQLNTQISFQNLIDEIQDQISSNSDFINSNSSKLYIVTFIYILFLIISDFIHKNNIYLLKKEKIFFSELANKDSLTNLFNRGYLDFILQDYQKQKNSLSYGIIFIDIDNFKQINDKYGHQFGDEILKRVANILNTNLRNIDIAGRWGGEEFMCLVISDDESSLFQIAQDIRILIEDSTDIKLTASFGCALNKKRDFIKVIESADKALYKAKKLGKNRVEMGE